MILGFGVQNHNDCRGEEAAVAKFANVSITDSTGPIALDPIAPVGVTGLTAVATTAGVSATWGVTGGDPGNGFVAERTFGAEFGSLALPLGTLRAAVDDGVPTGFVTYKLTPYSAAGVAGGSRRVSVSSTGLTAMGYITTWVTSPLLNQAYSAAGPGDLTMDFLAEGGNGPATERNILPVAGTQINPEYNGAAASTGCNCDTKALCNCSPLTFLLAQNEGNYGQLDCCDYFNCADNVMNYMVSYVTNNTGADLPVRFSYNTDDSVLIQIDNDAYHRDRACCYWGTGYGILPPGEHRLMLKVWEGGGGHNGLCGLVQMDGSRFPVGTITASPIPTMTSVPASTTGGMLADGRITDWLIIGQYAQSYGCGPTPDQMAQDFLTEGEGGVTEADIVPEAGMLVYTDYDAAASDGCNAGTAAGATCDPETVLSTYGVDGRVNFNTIFGDQDNLMGYLVCYLTNTTDQYVYANLGTGSDDSIFVKLDNMIVRAVSSCRGFTANQDQGLMVVPPGTHRLMLKVFEGGGGFDGGATLWSWTGGVIKAGVLTVSLTPPDGFVVPPAPKPITDLIATRGASSVTLSWTSPQVYGNIVVERKAALGNWTVLKGDLAGDATSFVDTAPDTAAAAIYYRVTAKILDGTTAAGSLVAGLVTPGYAVYQDGMFPTPAYAGTKDTHIILNTPDSNQGKSTLLEEGTCNGGQSDYKDTLVSFAIDALPAGKQLQSATMGTYFSQVRACTPSVHTVYLRQLLQEWGEGTGTGTDGPAALAGEASWNNARVGVAAWGMAGANSSSTDIMPLDPDDASVSYGPTAPAWVTFGGEGLPALVQYWLDGGDNFGVKITENADFDNPTPTYASGINDFNSRESSDPTLRPILILGYNKAPSVTVTGPASAELCGASVGVTFTATATDPDSDALTLTWTSSGGTVTPGAASATVDFTAVGDYTVTCTASDGIATASQTVTVSIVDCTVIPANWQMGDANNDTKVDISDAVYFLTWKFLGGTAPDCDKATNVNNDTQTDISDAVYLLTALFMGGPKPVAPDGIAVTDVQACVKVPDCAKSKGCGAP